MTLEMKPNIFGSIEYRDRFSLYGITVYTDFGEMVSSPTCNTCSLYTVGIFHMVIWYNTGGANFRFSKARELETMNFYVFSWGFVGFLIFAIFGHWMLRIRHYAKRLIRRLGW